VVLSFATVTELRYGAIRGKWGELRRRSLERNPRTFIVVQLGLADSVPVDPAMAIRAGLLRARHYHRQHRAVSLADCVAAEAARKHGAALATADPHLLDLCHDAAIDRVVLPDSTGSLWSR